MGEFGGDRAFEFVMLMLSSAAERRPCLRKSKRYCESFSTVSRNSLETLRLVISSVLTSRELRINELTCLVGDCWSSRFC